MRSLLVACVAAALVSAVRAQCDACLDGHCYGRRLIANASGGVADIDRKTNTLYIVDNNLIKKCNLDTAVCEIMNNQWRMDAVAVDQRTGDIYADAASPDQGIYKLDLVNNKRVLVDPAAGVWRMAFNDKLYYSSNHRGIFTSEEGISRIVPGTEAYSVLYFIVAKTDDIYFYDNTNMSKYVTRRLINGVLGGLIHPDNYFRWAVDKDGNAMYFDLYTEAIYRVTNEQSVEVGFVNESLFFFEFLFGRDNDLIYTAEEKRYHLKRNKTRCTISIIDNRRIINEMVVSPNITETVVSPLKEPPMKSIPSSTSI